MKIETRPRAASPAGVRHGRTLGGPIALQVANRDYANWEERMNPWPVEAEVARGPPAAPRPRRPRRHAGSTASTDVRNVLERASARETAARVAGGALAKAFLRALGVEIRSHVVQIGDVYARPRATTPLTRRGLRRRRRRPGPLPGPRGEPRDGRAHQRPAQGERVARRRLRGRRLRRSCPGLGSHVCWEERLDGRIARRALLDPGDQGRRARRRLRRRRRARAREAHDEIFFDRGARLLPRDQPRRRPRGRHDDGRAARRARRR